MDEELRKKIVEWFRKKYGSAMKIDDMYIVTDRKRGVVDHNEYGDVDLRVHIEYSYDEEQRVTNYVEKNESGDRSRCMRFVSGDYS